MQIYQMKNLSATFCKQTMPSLCQLRVTAACCARNFLFSLPEFWCSMSPACKYSKI